MTAALKAFALAGAMLLPSLVWAQGASDADRYWPGPHMWGVGGYGMIFGPLFMLLLLAVLIAAVVVIVRWIGGPWQGSAQPRSAPLDILKERFARGEIDKEEFEERRRLLAE